MPAQADSKFSIAHGKTTTSLPFELIDNRVFVEVRLNGQGPFHFILDSGAGGFSIDDAVAQKLGLQVEDAGQGTGVGEKTVRAGRAHLAEAQIGDLRFESAYFQAGILATCSARNLLMALSGWRFFSMSW